MEQGPGRLAGKVAFVTGGAQGLGAGIVEQFLREGAFVYFSDVQVEQGKQLAEKLAKNAIFLEQDVTDEKRWTEIMDLISKEKGRLDILVNNAGISGGGGENIEECSLDSWKRIHSVNSDAVFLGTQAGVKTMKNNQNPIGGSIINISSVLGLVGHPRLPAYCSSKGSVRLLTKSVATHCMEQRNSIRVNSIHPGYCWTPMVAKAVANSPVGEETLKEMMKAKQGGIMGQPKDIAYGCVYLGSDESRFVNGSELIIDGGYTCQ